MEKVRPSGPQAGRAAGICSAGVLHLKSAGSGTSESVPAGKMPFVPFRDELDGRQATRSAGVGDLDFTEQTCMPQ